MDFKNYVRAAILLQGLAERGAAKLKCADVRQDPHALTYRFEFVAIYPR